MDARDLMAAKRAAKVIRHVTFKPLKRGKLTRPFDKLGGARLTYAGPLELGSGYTALFLARDGDTLERRAFYGYLLQRHGPDWLPLAALHYHPSHKGVHLVLNCGQLPDYTGRLLPGAPELALRTACAYDPGADQGRLQLVHLFCTRLNIRLAPDDAQLL